MPRTGRRAGAYRVHVNARRFNARRLEEGGKRRERASGWKDAEDRAARGRIPGSCPPPSAASPAGTAAAPAHQRPKRGARGSQTLLSSYSPSPSPPPISNRAARAAHKVGGQRPLRLRGGLRLSGPGPRLPLRLLRLLRLLSHRLLCRRLLLYPQAAQGFVGAPPYRTPLARARLIRAPVRMCAEGTSTCAPLLLMCAEGTPTCAPMWRAGVVSPGRPFASYRAAAS